MRDAPKQKASQGDLDHCLGDVDAADDLDDEVFELGLIHELGAVIGAVGKEMLDPGPALADCMQDELGAGTVSDVRRRRIDHEQASIGIRRDVSLASDDLLSRVIAALFGPGAFTDWLSITPAEGCAARSLSATRLDEADVRSRG